MAESTFFFYDLETSGLDPKRHRIMQFAGRRTTMELEPIGDPVEFFVQLSPEVVPDPQAILTTGITPQYTREHGITEREAIAQIMNTCFTPNTITVGFNNIRFDDEFIRYTAYRNFWNPYEWAYADGRSRWDLLDVVRLVRALRPDGITWPFDDDGEPINRLELITAANGVAHTKAHDAMSDVDALIDVAKLIRTHQPKMFDYLLGLRGKHQINDLLNTPVSQPFIYASGRYGKVHNFTTAGARLAKLDNNKMIVWDLRFNPKDFEALSDDELAQRLFSSRQDLEEQGLTRLPVKVLATNQCPAIAPWASLRDEDALRLDLDRHAIQSNLRYLHQSNLPERLAAVYKARPPFTSSSSYDVDGALYDGFIESQNDKNMITTIRHTALDGLSRLVPQFDDMRLPQLWKRYLAHNYLTGLTDPERAEWQQYCDARRREDFTAVQERLDAIGDAKLKESLYAWADQPIN